MKYTILALALTAGTALATTYTPQVDPGTTNTLLVDARGLTGLSVEASGAGVAYYSDTLAVTNLPTAVSTVGVNFNGTNTLYTWTNQPPVTNSVIVTNWQTSIGFTNGDTGTSGNSLAFGDRNDQVYVFSVYPGFYQIPANTNALTLATNTFNFLTNIYPTYTLTWQAGGVFSFTTSNRAYLHVNQVGTDFTNSPVAVVYTTNTVVTTNAAILAGMTAQVAASPATQIYLVVTNGDNGLNGNTLAIVTGLATNQYVITNAPTGAQILATNNAPMLATNVYNFLATNYYGFALTWVGPTNFNIVNSPTNVNLSISNSVIFTNLSTTVYLTTNTVATNLYQVQIGATTNASATNFYNVLLRDYPNIRAAVATATVSLVTYSSYLFVTNSGTGATGYGISAQSTNTANGNIVITANVSGDTINWAPFPALNLTLSLASGAPNVATNTPLYGWPFVQLLVGSVATNGACPAFKLTAGGQ